MSPERRGLAAILGLLLLGSSPLFVSLRAINQEEQELLPLPVGEIISGKLRGGERRAYRFSIEPGRAFRITLNPRRGDFVFTLLDPFRSEQLLIDTRNGLHGLETFYAVSDASGHYLLEVISHAPAKWNGSYALKVEPPHPALREDRIRQAAMAAFSRSERLFSSGHDDSLRKAADEYGKALRLWQQVDERERAMATHYRLGRTLQKLGDGEKALDSYRSALREARSRHDRLAQAFLFDRIGRSLKSKEAEESYKQSLALFRREKYRPGEADVLNNLGFVYARRGNFPVGFAHILEGLKIWSELGGVLEEVYIRENLGKLHIGLAEPERALDQFEAALDIGSGNRELEARALGGLGAAHSNLDQGDQAIRELTSAVDLWRELGVRREMSVNLIRLGEAYIRLERLTEAREKLEEAVALSRKSPPDELVQAMALGALGHVLDRQGQEREAMAHFEQARAIFETQQDASAAAKALRWSVEAALGLGDLDTAHKVAQEAIAGVESLRSPFPTDFSLRRDLYDLHIEISMRLHEREPDKNYAARAFNAAEAARSRSLLDDVKALEADVQPGDPELLKQKAGLEESLIRLEMQRWAAPKGPEAEIDRRIRETETTLQVMRTRLEERGLEGSPRPMTLPEVQRSLDPDTLLLVYSLGPDRSWLWEITADRFETHELAGRSEIEAQAKTVNRLLSGNIHRDWRAWTPALKKLSRTLLSPVADRLEERQLLISPDGALYLTPFAALLDPRTLDRTGEPGGDPDSPRFLVFDHRLVMIPSISVVAAARDALSDRVPAQKEIAILAAPDFTGTDFEPLPHSRKEAEGIIRVASPGRSFLAMGPQASRSTATGPELGRYRFLHFATHGRLGERPDLSGIALSFREGFLRAFEIYDFKLSADLVVLSACETAVGGERGGLVRAFLHAGSKRVMATLWKVPDRSTPQIMETFYEGLLRQGVAPSAALQQAQIEMLKSSWKAPYYWAGFMLQGEWR